jgi:hypothetical protein
MSFTRNVCAEARLILLAGWQGVNVTGRRARVAPYP